MANSNSNKSNETDRDVRALERVKKRTIKTRDTTIHRIKNIHILSTQLVAEPNLIPKYLVAVGDLDFLWESFQIQNQAVLDALLDLGLDEEFSITLEAEVRSLYIEAIAEAEKHKTTSNAGSICNEERSDHGSKISHKSNNGINFHRSRLPDIPLPSYSGDLIGWPVFRDRFNALVVQRGDLSNIERFYYLLGCLKGEALHAISHIHVSESTYELAWVTLANSFDKPRQLATVIVDKILSMPTQSQESLTGLKEFLSVFSDQISVLRSLGIPQLEEFLLFALSVRCLPISTRKGFEATNVEEFPIVSSLINFVKNRVALLEVANFPVSARHTSNQHTKSASTSFRYGDKKPKVALLASKSNTSTSNDCLFCSGEHLSTNCNRFLKLSMDDRYATARDKKVCFRCLSSTHWSNRCKLTKSCIKCSGRHHTLLHRQTEPAVQPGPSSDTVLISSLNQPTVLLGTALVHVRDQAGCVHTVRALLDSASQVSVMSTTCADRLGLKRTKWTAPLTGLSGVSVPRVEGMVDCIVTPRYNSEDSFQVRAWVLHKITNELPSRQLSADFKEKYSHLALADPFFDKPAPVELLLGADVFAQILDGKRVIIDDALPTALGSMFGWILIGVIPDVEPTSFQSHMVSLTVSLEELVEQFWQTEEPAPAPIVFTNDGKCEAAYHAERVRDENGRFSVPLPFMDNYKNEAFSGSKQLAIRRFQNLERKLEANPSLKQAYSAFMSEYESLGHMSIAPSPGTYLSHTIPSSRMLLIPVVSVWYSMRRLSVRPVDL